MPFSSLREIHTCPGDLGRDGGIKSIIATHLAKKEEELCKGVDLLDIGGKVTYIGVNSEQDGVTELGAIKGKTQVSALINMVLQAPVD